MALLMGNPSEKAMIAMLLQMLGKRLKEEDQPQDGVLPPLTEAFQEKSIRTRPDFYPRP